jgi:ectoine hydroxylase
LLGTRLHACVVCGRHQDIQFWPHSNFAPLTIGVYLTDVDQDSGPMSVVPLSAHNTLHNHEDEDGNWLAILPDQALATVPIVRSAVPMTGKAGTVIVHNCRCVHGSPPNTSSTGPRPLLLQTFSPASCEVIPTGSNPSILSSPKGDQVIRGSSEALAAEWDDRARPLSQECNWMPDPSAVAFDWAAAAALLQTPRKKKKKS